VKGQAEEELLTAIAEHINEIWSELLEDLNRVVRHFRQTAQHPRVHFRMADFASFALQVAALWGCRREVEQSLMKLETSQAELVFEDEPIHQVLGPWLMIEANHGRNLEAGILQQEWIRLAAKNAIIWPFANGRSLG
jgi:nitrogen fixation/metabolism regulation signal transduction histidine kinase